MSRPRLPDGRFASPTAGAILRMIEHKNLALALIDTLPVPFAIRALEDKLQGLRKE